MHPQGPPAPDPDDAARTAAPADDATRPGPGAPRRRPPAQSEIRGINTIASLPPDARRGRGRRGAASRTGSAGSAGSAGHLGTPGTPDTDTAGRPPATGDA